MKRVFILFLVLTALSFGEEKSFGPITVEQAKQAIIQWSGRGNLQITFWDPEEYIAGQGTHPGRSAGGGIKGIHPTAHDRYVQCYGFFVDDPNPDKKYSGRVWVDSYTGAVVEIEKDNFKVREGNISDMLSPQQALSIAREAVASYFPNVPIYSFEDVVFFEPDMSGNGSWAYYEDYIRIIFYKSYVTQEGKKVDIDFQYARATIDSQTGEVWDVSAVYEPLERDPLPSLTVEEAVQSLVSYLYALGAQYVEVGLGPLYPDYPYTISPAWRLEKESPNGPQRVGIGIFCYLENPPDNPQLFPCPWIFCFVDGDTGEVIYGEFTDIGVPKSALQKASTPSVFFNGKEVKTKPLLKDGKLYINIKDLKAMGLNIEKKGEAYTISFRGNKATLLGKEILKKGKDVFIKGDSLSRLKGIITLYNKEGKRFHIVVANEKSYKRGLKERSLLQKGKKKQSSSYFTGEFSRAAIIGGGLSLSALSYAVWKFLKLLT